MRLANENIKNKEWCIEEYLNNKKSVKQIRRETGLGINTMKRWFRKHNIEIRQGDNEIVCSQKSHKMRKHPNWKGKRNNCGYYYIYHPNHPNAPKSGYISEHRFIAEQKVGRILNSDEFVHHIDMDKTNNELSNLYISKQRGHKEVHASFNRLCRELMNRGVVYFDQKEGRYGLRG
jgi:hypothetical protein